MRKGIPMIAEATASPTEQELSRYRNTLAHNSPLRLGTRLLLDIYGNRPTGKMPRGSLRRLEFAAEVVELRRWERSHKASIAKFAAEYEAEQMRAGAAEECDDDRDDDRDENFSIHRYSR